MAGRTQSDTENRPLAFTRATAILLGGAGRKRRPDPLVFQGILFVLHTGIAWEHLPQELGFGSGMTCWRRLAEWTEADGWPRLHEVLLAKLRNANAWTSPELPSTAPTSAR
ncbi:hypothetical protein GCM10017744_013080 [Streptomyces antimycoticus]|uniref:Insertion element IS402-like domain-containing protein n=1 Tax=Streptomyces antimycoticus TaxID=68175 RepID=A0A4D4KM17_9ACTN|nr:hypothetical protein SANT12839_087780 [Streptomyces antimycoticus]